MKKILDHLLIGLLGWSALVQAEPARELSASTGRVAQESTAAKPAAKLGAQDLRLNFRGASLDAVLKYLSSAAGFIVDLRTEVRGKVDVWSDEPVNREQAVAILNSALDKNGYAAIRQGRTLTICTKDEAKRRYLPVRVGSKPSEIPTTDEMVTQIIPLRFISATQVSQNLQPLLPSKATMSVNEGANSLLITDTQASIHRLTEIIAALDSALASVSSIRVLPLKYADAKTLAGVIKDLFQPQETARSGNQGQNGNAVTASFQTPDDGAPSFPEAATGAAGAGGRRSGTGAGGGQAPLARVVALAEEHSNSVIVSAPEEQVPLIASLVRQLDRDVQGITELRVFHLRYADAQETADLLSSLFPDRTSSTSQNSGGPVQFAGRQGDDGPPGAGRGDGNSTDGAARMSKQIPVMAVADLRTSSVVVSAARSLMEQIGKVVADLDADPSRKQQVYVYSVQHSDGESIQSILGTLFPSPTGTATSAQTSRQQSGTGNQLNNRASQTQTQRSSVGSGSSGVGGVGGGLGLSGTSR